MNIKKFSFYLIILTLVLGFSSSCNMNKQWSNSTPGFSSGYVEKGTDYQFEIVDDAIRLISHKYDNEREIIVPETIAEKPVEIIGENTFYHHKRTTSILLPENLTIIEGSPFYRCYSLMQITIPKNVKSIEANPFFRCSNLLRIIVDPQNNDYSDIDGVLFNKEQTVLISYPEGNERKSYTVPSSVTQLNIDSFGYHTKLNRLTILSNVSYFPEGNMFVFPDDICLVVESESSAEEYAVKHNLKYEIIE